MANDVRSLEQWSPYGQYVQGGIPPNNFISAKFAILCAGPPLFSQLNFGSGSAASVFPIGILQNFAHSANQSISRIFEIGSGRSYWVTGHSVAQISLGRVMVHGPSLLRCLYAYYDTSSSKFVKIPSLMDFGSIGNQTYPFTNGGATAVRSTRLHDVKVPPGYGNFFLNLASDMFSQSTGLLLIMKDNQENTYAACYFEQCMIPQHSWAFDAQGVIVQESAGIQYERMIPIKMSQVGLLRGLLADETGGYPNFG